MRLSLFFVAGISSTQTSVAPSGEPKLRSSKRNKDTVGDLFIHRSDDERLRSNSNDSVAPFVAGTVFRNPVAVHNGLLLRPLGSDANNTFDLFWNGLVESSEGDQGSFGSYVKESFTWVTYADMALYSKMLGRGITIQGLHGPVRDHLGRDWRMIGVYAEPSVAWAQTELAAARQNITLIPIYDTANPEFVESILRQTRVTTVFASTPNAGKLMQIVQDKRPGIHLGNVILFGTPEDRVVLVTKYTGLGVTIQLFEEVLFAGKQGLDQSPGPNDVNTICFTSGTTGEPKGVVITHGMLLSAVGGALAGDLGLMKSDIYFAFLPPAHIFARVVDLTLMYTGAKIAYYSGDKTNIGKEIKLVGPTLLAGVPRFLEKTLSRLQEGTRKGGRIKRYLVNRALKHSDRIMNGVPGYDRMAAIPITSAIILRRIRAALGGRLRLVLNGGGPLSPPAQAQLKQYLHIHVAQGYGLTETTGASMLQHPLSRTYGIVGIPLACVEVKLVDQELHANHGAGAGEIVMRGPAVFSEYFGNPLATAAAFTSDGWFKTGDIGLLVDDEVGRFQFRIVGRSKEIFKLPNGEYVVPAMVEGYYKLAECVEDIYVDRSPSGEGLIGLINVNPAFLERHVETFMSTDIGNRRFIPTGAEVLHDTKCLNSKELGLLAKIMSELEVVIKDHKLSPNVKLDSVVLTSTPFGPGTQYQTATMKPRRQLLARLLMESIALIPKP